MDHHANNLCLASRLRSKAMVQDYSDELWKPEFDSWIGHHVNNLCLASGLRSKAMVQDYSDEM